MMRDKSKDIIKKVMIEYTIEKDGFSLDRPGDESKLSQSIRRGLEPGEYVKLGFTWDERDGAEYMWLKIYSTIHGSSKRYTGEIDNISLYRPDFYGKVIEFGPDNIVDIQGENGKGILWEQLFAGEDWSEMRNTRKKRNNESEEKIIA